MFLTLDKHFMKFYKMIHFTKKMFKKYFFQAFNTIIPLFFTKVYIIIITQSLIFRDLY